MSKPENKKEEFTKEEIRKEAKAWAQFLYKLYRENPELVALVLEEGQ